MKIKKISIVFILFVSSYQLYGDVNSGIETNIKYNINDGLIDKFYLTNLSGNFGYFNFKCGIVDIPHFPYPSRSEPVSVKQLYLSAGLGLDIPINKWILRFSGNGGLSYSKPSFLFYINENFPLYHGEIDMNVLVPIPLPNSDYISYLSFNTGFSIMDFSPMGLFFHLGAGLKIPCI